MMGDRLDDEAGCSASRLDKYVDEEACRKPNKDMSKSSLQLISRVGIFLPVEIRFKASPADRFHHLASQKNHIRAQH